MFIREPKIKKMGVTGEENKAKISHLGIKPASGGRPPKESNANAITSKEVKFVFAKEVKDFREGPLRYQKYRNSTTE